MFFLYRTVLSSLGYIKFFHYVKHTLCTCTFQISAYLYRHIRYVNTYTYLFKNGITSSNTYIQVKLCVSSCFDKTVKHLVRGDKCTYLCTYMPTLPVHKKNNFCPGIHSSILVITSALNLEDCRFESPSGYK
jgi:hypothetical protein